MLIDYENLSDEEFFRIHGTLTPRRIEALLDAIRDQEEAPLECPECGFDLNS
jgi:hypothetical protein